VKYIQEWQDKLPSGSLSLFKSIACRSDLGISGTAVGERLGLSQSAVSRAVQRGERLISERNLSVMDDKNA